MFQIKMIHGNHSLLFFVTNLTTGYVRAFATKEPYKRDLYFAKEPYNFKRPQ